MSLVFPKTLMNVVACACRNDIRVAGSCRVAIRKTSIMAFMLMIGLCSISAGQSRVRSGSSMMRQQYMNQYNKMNEQQRKASADEAKALIKQSDSEIEKFESKLSSLKSDLDNAESEVGKLTKSLSECESDLRDARKKRTEREDNLLAEQDGSSRYQAISGRLKDAGGESMKQVARVLGRDVKDGDPDKLKLTLKKNEFKSLEEDNDCAEALKQYRKVKAEKADEVKRLLAQDKTIDKLDSAISKHVENEKVLKSQLSAARAKKKKIFNEKQSVTSNLAAVKSDRDAAKEFLAHLTKK